MGGDTGDGAWGSTGGGENALITHLASAIQKAGAGLLLAAVAPPHVGARRRRRVW